MSTTTAEEKLLVLKTNDDQEFQIKESTAIQSVIIKNMVDEDGSASIVFPLPNVDSKTLIQIIKYLDKHADDSKASEEELKNFDNELFDEIKSMEEILDIISAANYLNIPGLLDLFFQKVADKIKNKSPEYVRKIFRIENDFTEEEEAQIRKEHDWAFEGVDPDDE